jgi:hypothetical protein
VDEPDIEYLIKEIAKTANPFWVAEAISAEQADAAARSVAAAGLRRAQTAHPPRPRPQGPPRARQFREVNCLAPPRPRP